MLDSGLEMCPAKGLLVPNLKPNIGLDSGLEICTANGLPWNIISKSQTDWTPGQLENSQGPMQKFNAGKNEYYTRKADQNDMVLLVGGRS